MNVVMDEFAGNPLTISGINISTAGTLTMAQAGASWTTDQNIQSSATQANQALINLRNFQAQFATFNSYIKSRYDLNKAYQGDLKTQGDELVAADASEESANLVALQTRQQFAVQALTIGNQNEQSLLRLLG
jgi:flagellin